MATEVHFNKTEGLFKATLKRGKLSVELSFPSDQSADEKVMEEGLSLLHAIVVYTSGPEEARRVFLGLSKELEKAK